MSQWMSDHDNRIKLLRGLIAFSVLSTATHFTHNFLNVSDYPQSSLLPNSTVQVAVIISWPLLTGAGLYGYQLYKQRRYQTANLLIALYSGLGIATLGHFTAGNPQIPPFFYATIFTDALAGLSLLAFALYSVREPLAEPEPAAT
ncbi:MAG: hypothetical protein QOD60_336 [Solirubrobacterales bacterium]|jgi:hypothetical protein|nr:hypothetical protein [Solirubrobacterales bacterium]